MGIIARIYDFVAGTKIRSADIDAEFNQLVAAHNDHDSKITVIQSGRQLLSEKGVANGYVPLNSSTKIDSIYILDSILGQLEYQGTYNAATNVPTLPSVSASKGYFYVVSTAGTVSGINYSVGDWIVSNGTAWEKVDNTDAVVSFNGRLGAIVPASGDYNWSQINKTVSSLADLTTRLASDLTGTLKLAQLADGSIGLIKLDLTSLDSRYFTETETTSLLLANKNSDHAGTWQGLTPSAVGEGINGSRLDLIEPKLSTLPPTLLNLGYGFQVLNVSKTAPYNVLNIRGRTLVNLLGRDGNCEELSNFDIGNAITTKALDSSNYSVGLNSIKVSSTELGYFGLLKNVNVDNSKYYIIISEQKTDNAVTPSLDIWKIDGTAKVKDKIGSTASSLGFQKLYVALSPTDLAGLASIRVYPRFLGTTTANFGYVDAVRWFAITQTEYDALATMTAEQVAVKYPYVDDVKHVNGVYINVNNDSLMFPNTSLASNMDGTVYDRVYRDNGKWFRENRFVRDFVLDGSLPWTWDADYVGYKRITTPIYNPVSDSQNIVKFDGKIVPKGASTAGDQSVLNTTNVFITIADSDSGWFDAWVSADLPTEWNKAYMNGWKYTGTADKVTLSWVNVNGGAASPTQTLAYVSTTKAPNYTPYKLTYQLATSTIEEIAYEGSLSLLEGSNQFEVGNGLIVREKANPKLFDTTVGYLINYNGGTTAAVNTLTQRTKKILKVYKNGKEDLKWKIFDATNAYGNQHANLPFALFDPAAIYEVTYTALDQYTLTTNVQTLEGEYDSNIKMIVDRVVQNQADIDTRLSVVENSKARKVQGQWVLGTPLNGWGNTGAIGESVASYMKDEFNYVHLGGLLSGGVNTAGTSLMLLPAEYRPKVSATLTTSWSNVLITLRIGLGGNIGFHATNTATYIPLDGLSFKLD